MLSIQVNCIGQRILLDLCTYSLLSGFAYFGSLPTLSVEVEMYGHIDFTLVLVKVVLSTREMALGMLSVVKRAPIDAFMLGICCFS